jgi:BirA family transcriptional regulator, biotin operon repressor / biotin---[acetyl-CoA-carboxylase] ligase
MLRLDIEALVARLTVIESIAVIPRVTSTHDLARTIVAECLDNELPAPAVSLIALEQTAGRGRGARRWSSPAGGGIYATTIHTLPATELPLYPLYIGSVVATFLRGTYGIDAGLKWPNDILVGGRKIAGVLLEARTQEGRSSLLISVGINVAATAGQSEANATSIADSQADPAPSLAQAITRFLEFLDRHLATVPDAGTLLPLWRGLTVHRDGDRVASIVGDRSINGSWRGIDDEGHALIESDGELLTIAAGDVIIQ